MASKNKGLSRRDFLRQSSCFSSVAAMQSLGLASLLGASKSIASDDYKALVFIFLDGGNDAFNMLVPRGTGALRTDYEAGRRVVALAANELQPITYQCQLRYTVEKIIMILVCIQRAVIWPKCLTIKRCRSFVILVIYLSRPRAISF